MKGKLASTSYRVSYSSFINLVVNIIKFLFSICRFFIGQTHMVIRIFSGQIPMVLHLVMSGILRFRLLAFIVFKQLFHLNIILSSIYRFN